MIREMLTDFILILVLASVCGSFVVLQKSSVRQQERIERIIEKANEPY